MTDSKSDDYIASFSSSHQKEALERIEQTLARIERLLERIAEGLGVAPHG